MNLKQKITNIYKGWKNLFIPIEEIEELALERIKICNYCDKNKLGICIECGCPLVSKTRSLGEDCPLNKWLPLIYEDSSGGYILREELPEGLRKYFDTEVINLEIWEEFKEKYG